MKSDDSILLIGSDLFKISKEECFKINLNDVLKQSKFQICSIEIRNDHIYITNESKIHKINLKKFEFIKIPKGGEYTYLPSTITKSLISKDEKNIGILHNNRILKISSLNHLKPEELVIEFKSVLDFVWWDDSSIVILNDDYEISIMDLKDQILMEGSKLELSGLSKLSTMNHGKMYFLECEVEDIEEIIPERGNILYGLYQLFHSMVFPEMEKKMKYSLFYKLIGFKEKKPISILMELLSNEKYVEANAYAKSFELSEDLIYQHQWNESEKDEGDFGILEDIKDKDWVIHECLICHTDSVEKKNNLLKYALNLCEKLNKSDPKIREFHSKMETYLQIHSFDWDKVKTFCESNLMDSIQVLSVKKNFSGVETILTRHPNETLPKLLEILSSIPETIDPSSYENLLPKFENGKLVPWQCIDCEFTPNIEKKTITKWFIDRAYEIESKCGFINNSLTLLEIGMKNNVEGLESLYYIVSSVNYQVYECDSDITIKDFENLNNKEKIDLLLSNTSQDCKTIYDILTSKARDYLHKDFTGKGK
jgi:hypothetical protein